MIMNFQGNETQENLPVKVLASSYLSLQDFRRFIKLRNDKGTFISKISKVYLGSGNFYRNKINKYSDTEPCQRVLQMLKFENY